MALFELKLKQKCECSLSRLFMHWKTELPNTNVMYEVLYN